MFLSLYGYIFFIWESGALVGINLHDTSDRGEGWLVLLQRP